MAAHLGRAVTRTLALLPTDSRCSLASLVLSRLLERRGIDARLVVAVCRSPSSPPMPGWRRGPPAAPGRRSRLPAAGGALSGAVPEPSAAPGIAVALAGGDSPLRKALTRSLVADSLDVVEERDSDVLVWIGSLVDHGQRPSLRDALDTDQARDRRGPGGRGDRSA